MTTQLKNYSYFLFLFLLWPDSVIYANSIGPRGMQPLDWHTEQISQVISFLPITAPRHTKTERIAGKKCMRAYLLNVDVLDEYAHDIDETVRVEIEFDLEKSSTDVVLQYDKNGDISGTKEVKLPKKGGGRWYRHTFTLERARFSGRRITSALSNFTSGDFSIGTPFSWDGKDSITVCDITLKRSYTTPQPVAYGRFALDLVDEFGSGISARVGIYDATGRMPLPETEAIPIKYFSDITRTVVVPPGRVSWPTKNHYAFYVNGSYHASLPVGRYDIVVARGLEYRILQQSFVIEDGEETPLVMKLSRWTDMPAKGWYSGETHIHYGRASEEDSNNIRLHIRAEDLNVANLLRMGNIGASYFQQYNWGEEARYGDVPYTLVPGQEDPRTLRRGHTIQLNINSPIRNSERYYLYHEVFEEVRKQGGLTGYAHVGGYPGVRAGLALDIPYGLVDFVEVLQVAHAGVENWFDFLNLGYKLSPAAGTDYPYGDVPGAVRNYVKVDAPYSVQGWFDGLKAGRTFVTNGPMLALTVNGKGMGADVRVKKGSLLTIEARATLNPDIDQLDRIELIQQGEIVAKASSKEGAGELRLKHEIRAEQGSWFVLRAQGKQEKLRENVVAVSAPVYVYVDGNGFCKTSAVPSIVAEQKEQLQKMLVSIIEEQYDFEAWDTWEPRVKYWPTNKILLQKRIEDVNRKYDDLVTRAGEQSCITD